MSYVSNVSYYMTHMLWLIWYNLWTIWYGHMKFTLTQVFERTLHSSPASQWEFVSHGPLSSDEDPQSWMRHFCSPLSPGLHISLQVSNLAKFTGMPVLGGCEFSDLGCNDSFSEHDSSHLFSICFTFSVKLPCHRSNASSILLSNDCSAAWTFAMS